MPPKKPAASVPREDPQQYVLKKNFKKAIELYRAYVKDSPDDPNLVLRLGDVLVLDNQIPGAVVEYKKAAQIFADQGFLLKAIGVNKKIVKIDPSQEEIHQSLSKLYEERGVLASSASKAAASTAGGQIQFDMEAEPEGGMDLDLGIPSPATGDAARTVRDEADGMPGPDDVTGFAGESPAADAGSTGFSFDGGSASTPVGFDFGGGGLATAPAPAAPSAPGGFDFGAGADTSAVPAAVPDDEIGVDALADALADLPAESADLAALESLGVDLAPDDLGSADAARQRAAKPVESIRRTPLVSDLTADELTELMRQMTSESYAEGAVVVREGDPGDSLFTIVTGSVRVMTTMKGKEIQLAVLAEGEFFGEGSLITGKPRTATIVANEDCELLCLSKAALDTIVAKHPRVRDVMVEFYRQRAENTVRAVLRSAKK